MAARPGIPHLLLLIAALLSPFAAPAQDESNCRDSIIRLEYQPILSIQARELLQDSGAFPVLQAAEKVQTDGAYSGCTLRFNYVPDSDGSAYSAKLRRLFRHLLVPAPAPGRLNPDSVSLLAPGQGLIDVDETPPASLVVPLYPVDPHHSPPIKFLLIFDLSDSGIFSRTATHINRIRQQFEQRLFPGDDLELWGFAGDWVRLPRVDLTNEQLKQIVRAAGNDKTDLCLAISRPAEAHPEWHHVLAIFTDGEYDPSDKSTCEITPPAIALKPESTAKQAPSGSDATVNRALPNDFNDVARWLTDTSWSSYHIFFLLTPFRDGYEPKSATGEPAAADPQVRASRFRAKVIGRHPIEIVATERTGQLGTTDGIAPSIDYLFARVGREPRIVLQGKWDAHDVLRVQVGNHASCHFDPSQLAPRILAAEPGRAVVEATRDAFASLNMQNPRADGYPNLTVHQGQASLLYEFHRPESLDTGSYAVYSLLGNDRKHAISVKQRPPVLAGSYPEDAKVPEPTCAGIAIYDVPALFAKDVVDIRVSVDSRYHLGPGERILSEIGLELQYLYPMLLGEDGKMIEFYFRHHGVPWYHITGKVDKEHRAEGKPEIEQPHQLASTPESGFPAYDGYSRSEMFLPLKPSYPMRVLSDIELHLAYDFGSGDHYPVPPIDYASTAGSHYRLVDGVPTITIDRYYVDNDQLNKWFRRILWFCYAVLFATLLRYFFSRWFPVPRSLRGFAADARPDGGSPPSTSPFRIRYSHNGYRFENSTAGPITMCCRGSTDVLHSFPAGEERLSASELVELGDNANLLVYRLVGDQQVYDMQWRRRGIVVGRVTRSRRRRPSSVWMRSSTIPDKGFWELCSPAEILGSTRIPGGTWLTEAARASLIAVIAGYAFVGFGLSATSVLILTLLAFLVLWFRAFLHICFWFVVATLRIVARYFGLKSLSASVWHYRPRFAAGPRLQSAMERFRDSVLPAFFLTYPLVYLWLYKGDSSEWATTFGIWVIVGVVVVAYMLDRFRAATIKGGAMLLGVSSFPLWIELARAFNNIGG